MTLFKNKYRIESARLPKWDYSSSGYYFVTICVYNRVCLYGNIVNGQMQLNTYGKIVYDEWNKSFDIRKELRIDEYVVMPNHFHGIVQIVETHDRGPVASVETHGRASLRQPNHGVAYRSPKSISSMIAGYKSIVTKRINECRQTPGRSLWQFRFYDRIIRNDRELFAIRRYIKNNPVNWAHDRNIVETMGETVGNEPWLVYMQ